MTHILMMQTIEQLQAGQLKGSKRLKLSCGLSTFPPEIFDLADTLEILDLSGNQLSQLPDDLYRLSKLKIAFFSDNHFQVFPKVLSKLPALEMIGFKANKITEFPEDSLPLNTRWLILTNNLLSSVPKSIGKCMRMQKLMLAGNRLSSLPHEMSNCQHLELLRISANEFEELPSWLLQLPRLSWLAFGGNPASTSPVSRQDLLDIPWTELKVQELLGEGASGLIYKAYWTSAQKYVAVKVFKGEVTSDGLPMDEMQACISSGIHKHLVPVLGKISQHPEAKLGLVLELIPPAFKNLGGPPNFDTCTRDVYETETCFSLDQVFNILLGIASASEHLHACGIMHGDLYAHNILVSESGNPLLSDFGAAWSYSLNRGPYASALQRIEVRAFGCLLEDLLMHLDGHGNDSQRLKQLDALAKQCMSIDLSERMMFERISIRLKALLLK